MFNTIHTFIPKFIRQEIDARSRTVITSTRWNELWNLNITQGDHNSEILVDVVQNLLEVLNNLNNHLADPILHVAMPTNTQPIPNTPILRDAEGRAQVSTPSVGADIARLDTVINHTTMSEPGGVFLSQLTQGMIFAQSGSGLIKIKMPHSWIDRTMRFSIFSYDWRDGETSGSSFYTEVAGLMSTTTGWSNPSAVTLSPRTRRDLTVRFAHDGDTCCILIGELTSAWNWMHLTIRDFSASWGAHDIPFWQTGWSVSVIPNLAGITVHKTIPDVRAILTHSGAQNIWVQANAPTAVAVGDIWIDT